MLVPKAGYLFNQEEDWEIGGWSIKNDHFIQKLVIWAKDSDHNKEMSTKLLVSWIHILTKELLIYTCWCITNENP